MVDVSFHVRLDRAAIHTNDFTWWQNAIARDTDTQVMTWPEVYEFIARSWIAGGDYASYVRSTSVDVERTDDSGFDPRPMAVRNGFTGRGTRP